MAPPSDPIVVDDELGDDAVENQTINEVRFASQSDTIPDSRRNTKYGRRSTTGPRLQLTLSTPFLYDTVITHALTWPSLTCQWLPDEHT